MPAEQLSSLKAKRKKRMKKERRQQNAKGKGKTIHPEFLHPFSADTSSHQKIDFIKLLPAEIRELILLYLDVRTLTASCCVSKTWYELVSPCDRVWRQACQSLDLIIADEGSCDESYWRTLFLKMYKRRYQMLNSQSFVCYTYKSRVPITAVYYYNGKLATASAYTTKIKIWERATFECLLTVKCHSWISSVKFDDFVIMAATDHGGIQCWDVTLGHLIRCYLSEINFVSCFDYSLRTDFVVGGFHNKSIRIWEMSTAVAKVALHGHSSTVTKVMLRPQFTKDGTQEQQTLLLSMDAETIFVRFLSFVSESDHSAAYLKVLTWYKISFEYRPCVPRRLTPNIGHYVRILAQSSSGILLLSPQCIFTESCKGFLPSVFKFDGEFLYFAFQGDSVALCKWDFKNRCTISNTDNQSGKISALLSIGRLYMTYIVLWKKEQLFLIVIDKNRKQTVSSIALPMNGPSETVFEPHSHRSRLCHGEESWLDGFDAKNDQGVILVAAPEPTHLFIMEWN